MRLSWTLVASHLMTAVIAIVMGAWSQGLSSSHIPAFSMAAMCGAAMGVLQLHLLRKGLKKLQQHVAAGETMTVSSTGLAELDHTAEALHHCIHRWADAANTYRRQMRECEELLSSLDAGFSSEESTRFSSLAHHLRHVIGRVASDCDGSVQQMLQHTGELRETTRQMASDTDQQSNAVVKSTTYVEQLTSRFDEVARHARAAGDTTGAARESAQSAERLLHELNSGMEVLGRQVQRAEKRLSLLGERTQEIGKIVEAIGAISSRTDLLALNASIESYRAGEQGRGFAVVAEEVRTLAEQAAQASREIAGLIDSIQFETQESITAMSDQNGRVADELRRAAAAREELSRILATCGESAGHCSEIDKLSHAQLHAVQELVEAVEQISHVARSNRSRAESVGWTMQNIGQLTERLDSVLQPLRGKAEPRLSSKGRDSNRPSSRRSEQSRPSEPNDRSGSGSRASAEALELLHELESE